MFLIHCFAEKNQDRGVHVSQGGEQQEEEAKAEKGSQEERARHSHNERPKDKKPYNKVKCKFVTSDNKV